MASALLALVACRAPPRTTPVSVAIAVIGPDAAAARVGQEVRVRMLVRCVDVGNRVSPTCLRPTCYYEGFLFRLCIPPQLVEGFEQAVRGPIDERLLERLVDATGVVVKNGQWSEIVITETNQIRVATGLTPPSEPTRLPMPPTKP